MTHPLQRQVRLIGQQARTWMLWGAMGSSVGIVLFCLFIIGILDYVFVVRDVGIRSMASATIVAAAGLGWWRFVLPALKTQHDDVTVARRIEILLPEIRNQLSSAVSFLEQEEEDATVGSLQLRRAVISDMTNRCDQMELPELADRKPALRAALAIGVLAVLISVACLADGRSVARGLRRIAVPWSAVGWNELEVVNAPQQIAEGDSFLLRVRDRQGRLPATLYVDYWFDGDEPDEMRHEVIETQGDTAEHTMSNLDRSFRFRVAGGDDHSMPWKKVKVVEPPRLEELSLLLCPPIYTGWGDVTAEDPIVALAGTSVVAIGSTSKPISSAKLVVTTSESTVSHEAVVAEDGTQFVLDGRGVSDEQGKAAWIIQESGHVDIELHGRDGIVNRSSARREIRAVVHHAPKVTLTRPDSHQFVTPRALLPLEIEVAEQISVEQVQVHFVRPTGDTPTEVTIDITAQSEDAPVTLPGEWASQEPDVTTYRSRIDLASLAPLRTGERLEMRSSATNGKPLIGESETIRLNVVSDDELADRLAPTQRYVLHQLSEMIGQQRQSRNRSAVLETGLGERRHMTSADENELQNVEFEQHQVRRFLRAGEDSILPRLEWVLGQFDQNRLERSDLRQRIQNLHQRLVVLDQSELTRIDERFVSLRRTARGISRHDGQTAADTDGDARVEATSFKLFQRDFESVCQSQEQVIEKLEQLRREFAQWDNYHSLAGEFRKLRSHQETLASRTEEYQWDTIEKGMPDGEQRTLRSTLVREQLDLADRVDDIQGRMTDMQDVLSQSEPAAADSIADALHWAARQGIRNTMQQVSDAIKNDQAGRAVGAQRQLVDDLDEIIAILTHREERQLQRRLAQLRAAAKELDELSQRVSDLHVDLKAADSDNLIRAPRQLQRSSQEISELRERTARLKRQLARLQAIRTAEQLERAAQNMNRSAELAGHGMAEDAGSQAEQAVADLDQARQQLAETTRQVEQALLDEQLAQLEDHLMGLIDRQESARGEIERLDELREADDWTPGQLDSLQRLAVDESALAEETEQLAENLQQTTVFQFGLNRVAEHMRQVVERLDEHQVERTTQELATAALAGLVGLRDALRDEDAAGPEKENDAGGGGGSGGQSPSSASKVSSAELKLMRTLQDQVRQRTVDLHKGRPAAQPLSADQIRDLQLVAEEQEQLAELMFEMLEPDETGE